MAEKFVAISAFDCPALSGVVELANAREIGHRSVCGSQVLSSQVFVLVARPILAS